MELLFLTVCFAASALTQGYYSSDFGGDFGGHRNGGWGSGMVVSKRDVSASEIYEGVKATLDKATAGITADELQAAAVIIQTSADAYVDATGGTVPANDIMAVIDEVASTFNGAVAVSALFDTQLIFEGSLLDSAFCLWDGLVDKAKQLEAAGESPVAAIAAISMTATAIQGIAVATVGTIVHLRLEKQEGVDVPPEEEAKAKRWEVEGEVGHDSSGTSGRVKVSHSWRRHPLTRAISAEEEQDNLEKRVWGGDRPGGDRPGGGRPGGGRPGGGWKRRSDGSSDDAAEQDDKRGGWGSGNDRPSGGGGSGGGGGGGSWKGRSVEKKGKWSGSVSGGYSTSGGASVGVGVKYSWRRR